MDIVQIITLAIIQGLTEFLPISSSAHLILVPHLFGWQDQGLAFDVAMHIGSLIAVLFYFRQDLKLLLLNGFESIKTRQFTSESRLLWGIIVATIPVAVVGLLITTTHWDQTLRSPTVIAVTLIFFGLLLGLADWLSKHERDEYSLSWRDIMLIGLAQALALIPGTSRSGVTMTAALLLGLRRKAAARFSFLLSIPGILLAGLHESVLLIKQDEAVAWLDLLLGALFSALSAYFCIKIFLGILDRIGMLPFVFYRLILGVVLIIWFT
jgi:undecaprenyl-diphosphatase